MRVHRDIEFMSELNAAVREQVHTGARILMYTCVAVVTWALVWAWAAELDEVARGAGKIVPFTKVQVVGNLEGGIVESIPVKVGDLVAEGQVLFKLVNERLHSQCEETSVRLGDLRIRLARLNAENTGQPFHIESAQARAHPQMVQAERALFTSNVQVRDNLLSICDSQIGQRRQEIVEARSRARNQHAAIRSIEAELVLTRPLVQKRICSQVDLLRLERERASIRERLDGALDTIPRLEGSLVELERKKDDIRMSHRARTQKDLSDTTLEIHQLEKLQVGLVDQMARALVRSPVKGIIKQLFVTTLGGVVKPGMDLAEVVPVDDNLLIEVRVRPADIGFIHVGQPATVKVSAYDFSIYGGFPGTVVNVGADSQTDEQKQTYFVVWIRTERNYLGTTDRPLRVIPGMTVTADILTGKKTVLQYLLKPILKAQQSALRER